MDHIHQTSLAKHHRKKFKFEIRYKGKEKNIIMHCGSGRRGSESPELK